MSTNSQNLPAALVSHLERQQKSLSRIELALQGFHELLTRSSDTAPVQVIDVMGRAATEADALRAERAELAEHFELSPSKMTLTRLLSELPESQRRRVAVLQERLEVQARAVHVLQSKVLLMSRTQVNMGTELLELISNEVSPQHYDTRGIVKTTTGGHIVNTEC